MRPSLRDGRGRVPLLAVEAHARTHSDGAIWTEIDRKLPVLSVRMADAMQRPSFNSRGLGLQACCSRTDFGWEQLIVSGIRLAVVPSRETSP